MKIRETKKLFFLFLMKILYIQTNKNNNNYCYNFFKIKISRAVIADLITCEGYLQHLFL